MLRPPLPVCLSHLRKMIHNFPANGLSKEKSPYLLQHAYNPVNWHPWGEEAFSIARDQNKPIFLSVGYSTCHWCHVMERESFVNEDVAKLMNDNFVSIKVDREERPDVDRLYMAFISSITGSGGWPMSAFLTPSGEPLTGGTYFPPDDTYGQMGFKSILKLVSEQWRENNESVRNQGKALSRAIQQQLKATSSTAPSANIMMQEAYEKLVRGYDEDFGGFGIGPKFPKPVDLEFLMYYYKSHPNSELGTFAMEALSKTLDEINRGGIHDHIGHGFHRYAVDRQWKIPHFEKMLYDQGQLLSIYANFFKLTGRFADVIDDIVTYVKENLTHSQGGFFAAEDAESYPHEGAKEKKEGAFFTWTTKELEELLTPEQRAAVVVYYGFEEEGNAPKETDIRGELRGQNVPFVGRKSIVQLAEHVKTSPSNFRESIESAKSVLWTHRAKRPRPSLDSKIITAWNGLMISGLATAFSACPSKTEYVSMAQKAVQFIRKHLVDTNGRLLRTAYGDESLSDVVQTPTPILAFSDDYAFLIQALLDLYEVDFDESHLSWAVELQNELDELFFDTEMRSGYFNSRANDSTVFVRMQDDQDGVEPCTNSVAALNLIRLSEFMNNQQYRQKASNIFEGNAERLQKAPFVLPKMVMAAKRYSACSTQIVIVAPSNADDVAREMVAKVQKRYLPDKSLVRLSADVDDSYLTKKNTHFKNLLSAGKKSASAFVCENFTCNLPVDSLADLDGILDKLPRA